MSSDHEVSKEATFDLNSDEPLDIHFHDDDKEWHLNQGQHDEVIFPEDHPYILKKLRDQKRKQKVAKYPFSGVREKCPDCPGDGLRNSDICSSCRGNGMVPIPVKVKYEECEMCGGCGECDLGEPPTECDKCEGSGLVPVCEKCEEPVRQHKGKMIHDDIADENKCLTGDRSWGGDYSLTRESQVGYNLCGRCKGSGRYEDNECKNCKGSGIGLWTQKMEDSVTELVDLILKPRTSALGDSGDRTYTLCDFCNGEAEVPTCQECMTNCTVEAGCHCTYCDEDGPYVPCDWCEGSGLVEMQNRFSELGPKKSKKLPYTSCWDCDGSGINQSWPSIIVGNGCVTCEGSGLLPACPKCKSALKPLWKPGDPTTPEWQNWMHQWYKDEQACGTVYVRTGAKSFYEVCPECDGSGKNDSPTRRELKGKDCRLCFGSGIADSESLDAVEPWGSDCPQCEGKETFTGRYETGTGLEIWKSPDDCPGCGGEGTMHEPLRDFIQKQKTAAREKYQIKGWQPCGECKGDGGGNSWESDCWACEGSGIVPTCAGCDGPLLNISFNELGWTHLNTSDMNKHFEGKVTAADLGKLVDEQVAEDSTVTQKFEPEYQTCFACEGTGKVFDKYECTICGGSGLYLTPGGTSWHHKSSNSGEWCSCGHGAESHGGPEGYECDQCPNGMCNGQSMTDSYQVCQGCNGDGCDYCEDSGLIPPVLGHRDEKNDISHHENMSPNEILKHNGINLDWMKVQLEQKKLAFWKKKQGPKVTFVQGDITTQDTDAIVNAANEALLGGGGVDAAIHQAAGPELLEYCKALRETDHPDGIEAGQAVVTPGGDLPAKHVIHAVGPRYDSHPDPAGALHSAYAESLARADEVGAKSVSFPAISTGIFGYPLEEASKIAVNAVRTTPTNVKEVRFVSFDDKTHAAFSKHAAGAKLDLVYAPCSNHKGMWTEDEKQNCQTCGGSGLELTCKDCGTPAKRGEYGAFHATDSPKAYNCPAFGRELRYSKVASSDYQICETCGGNGHAPGLLREDPPRDFPCWVCEGSGLAESCSKCGGQVRGSVMRSDVKVHVSAPSVLAESCDDRTASTETSYELCKVCRGTDDHPFAKFRNSECAYCGGSGVADRNRMRYEVLRYYDAYPDQPDVNSMGYEHQSKVATYGPGITGVEYVPCPKCKDNGSLAPVGWAIDEGKECNRCKGSGLMATCKTCRGELMTRQIPQPGMAMPPKGLDHKYVLDDEQRSMHIRDRFKEAQSKPKGYTHCEMCAGSGKIDWKDKKGAPCFSCDGSGLMSTCSECGEEMTIARAQSLRNPTDKDEWMHAYQWEGDEQCSGTEMDQKMKWVRIVRRGHVGDDNAMHHSGADKLREEHPYWDTCRACGGDGIEIGSTDVTTGEQKQKPCSECKGIGEEHDLEYWDTDEQLHDFKNYPAIKSMDIPDKPLKKHIKDNHEGEYDDPYSYHQQTHGIGVDPDIAALLLQDGKQKKAAASDGRDMTQYQVCSMCKGSGNAWNLPCPSCKGSGLDITCKGCGNRAYFSSTTQEWRHTADAMPGWSVIPANLNDCRWKLADGKQKQGAKEIAYIGCSICGGSGESDPERPWETECANCGGSGIGQACGGCGVELYRLSPAAASISGVDYVHSRGSACARYGTSKKEAKELENCPNCSSSHVTLIQGGGKHCWNCNTRIQSPDVAARLPQEETPNIIWRAPKKEGGKLPEDTNAYMLRHHIRTDHGLDEEEIGIEPTGKPDELKKLHDKLEMQKTAAGYETCRYCSGKGCVTCGDSGLLVDGFSLRDHMWENHGEIEGNWFYHTTQLDQDDRLQSAHVDTHAGDVCKECEIPKSSHEQMWGKDDHSFVRQSAKKKRRKKRKYDQAPTHNPAQQVGPYDPPNPQRAGHQEWVL